MRTKSPELVSVSQAGEYLDVSPDTIRRMIARGDLTAYRYGPRLIRIDLADLEKMRRPVTSTAAYRDALAEREEALRAREEALNAREALVR